MINSKNSTDVCKCGHKRELHGKSNSINYTDCKNFIIKSENKITILKSKCADTRTFDYTKVSKDLLYKESISHIRDVRMGIEYIVRCLKVAAFHHDYTKIKNIEEFYKDFKTGFKKKSWWEMHQEKERHHFNKDECIQKDINLIDIIEQIVDGVMNGMAQSGEYRYEPLNSELLQRAYENTAKLLLDNIEIVEY